MPYKNVFNANDRRVCYTLLLGGRSADESNPDKFIRWFHENQRDKNSVRFAPG